MDWSTVQQLVRIILYSGASFFLGTGVADGELVQSAIAGAVAVGAFLWWLAFERDRKATGG